MRFLIILVLLGVCAFGGYYVLKNSQYSSLFFDTPSVDEVRTSAKNAINSKTDLPLVGEKTFVITEKYLNDLLGHELATNSNIVGYTKDENAFSDTVTDIKTDGIIIIDTDMHKPLSAHLTLTFAPSLENKKLVLKLLSVKAGDILLSSVVEKTIASLLPPLIGTVTGAINQLNYTSLKFFDNRVELEAEALF